MGTLAISWGLAIVGGLVYLHLESLYLWWLTPRPLPDGSEIGSRLFAMAAIDGVLGLGLAVTAGGLRRFFQGRTLDKPTIISPSGSLLPFVFEPPGESRLASSGCVSALGLLIGLLGAICLWFPRTNLTDVGLVAGFLIGGAGGLFLLLGGLLLYAAIFLFPWSYTFTETEIQARYLLRSNHDDVSGLKEIAYHADGLYGSLSRTLKFHFASGQTTSMPVHALSASSRAAAEGHLARLKRQLEWLYGLIPYSPAGERDYLAALELMPALGYLRDRLLLKKTYSLAEVYPLLGQIRSEQNLAGELALDPFNPRFKAIFLQAIGKTYHTPAEIEQHQPDLQTITLQLAEPGLTLAELRLWLGEEIQSAWNWRDGVSILYTQNFPKTGWIRQIGVEIVGEQFEITHGQLQRVDRRTERAYPVSDDELSFREISFSCTSPLF